MKRRNPHIAQFEEMLDLPLPVLWEKFNASQDRAAASTIDALSYALRKGPTALSEPATLERLRQLDQEQFTALAMRVQRYGAHVAPRWTDADLEKLIETWTRCHG